MKKTERTDPKIPRPPRTAAKPVEFCCTAPDADAVYLAGTFNEWSSDTTPMQRSEEGLWSVVVPLDPGRYEYKFVVDGGWVSEPGCRGTSADCPECVPNEFGTMNRVLEIA